MGGPPSLPQDTTREAMWPAPTAADWALPCAITFQRSWDDALAVAKQTGKPILVCVNMDGEIASEHYAGIRYRQPEIAKLYDPYVCVIASVYRHTPADHDQSGKRILCPRFGSVTCGEHIEIEPLLYEKFMDGRRIAPRHIMVEVGQPQKLYDVFYAWDTDTVFNTIRDGVAERPPPPPIARGDRPLLERVGSADVEDRQAVENAYVQGTREVRRSLLQAALSHRELDSVELLRLALFGLDAELARLARQALAQSGSEGAIDLIADALRAPLEPGEREMLIAALERLGETFPRARTLAAVHRSLGERSGLVDVNGWSEALANSAAPPPTAGRSVLESRLEYQVDASTARPDDGSTRLDLADTYLALARESTSSPRFERVFYDDARRSAFEAEQRGASGWRVDSTLAVAAYKLDDIEEALTRAEAAMHVLPEDPQGETAVTVIALFAQARQRAIADAVNGQKEWPPEWLTDVNAAYTLLERHPLGTDLNFAAHYDFLRALRAHGPAAQALDAGLARFPDSWVLHDRFRGRIIHERGVAALEAAYDELLAAPAAPPTLEWFAGYASITAAEFHRRAGRDREAAAAYERALAHYDKSIALVPTTQESADHYAAIALAGQARIALERSDLDAALAAILASFERKPDAAASLDGLNLSPADTAKMLRARLREAGDDAALAQLQAALDALDPQLLELPAYEREVPPAGERRPRRGPGARDR